MTYKTDNGGVAFKANDAKLYFAGSTWGMKLSQLNRQSGVVRIVTYSLPDMAYVKQQFERRPYDIWIICHTKFIDRAETLKRTFPDVRIAVRNDVHAKVLLIEPSTLYVTSANFGASHWIESGIGIHSKPAHDSALATFENVWSGSREIAAKSGGHVCVARPTSRLCIHCGEDF